MLRYFSKFINIYTVLFLIYLMLNSILPFVMYVPSILKSILSVGFMVLGLVFIFYKLIKNKESMFTIDSIFLYCYIIAIAISSLTMLKYGYVDNFKTIIWSMISLILLYHMFDLVEKSRIENNVQKAIFVLNIIWNCAILVSLYQFVFQISYQVKLTSGAIAKAQGFYYNRLFGIFIDPNYAAVTSVVMFYLTIYLLKNTNKKIFRIIEILFLILEFLYVVLSASRTGLLVMLVGAFVYSFFRFRQNLINNSKKYVIIKSVIGGILVVLAVYFGVQITKKATVYIFNENKKVVEDNIEKEKLTNAEKISEQQNIENTNKDKVQNESKNNKLTLERTDLEGKEDKTNLRVQLWGDCIKIFKSKMLFGTSPRNFVAYAKENYKGTYPAKGYDCGNGYLAVLVYTGIFGSVCIVAFMICYFKKLLKVLISKKNLELIDIVALSITAIIGVAAAINQEIFLINSFNTAVFWILLGFMIRKMNKNE